MHGDAVTFSFGNIFMDTCCEDYDYCFSMSSCLQNPEMKGTQEKNHNECAFTPIIIMALAK